MKIKFLICGLNAVLICFFLVPLHVSAQDNASPIVDEIFRDVIYYTQRKADEVVREQRKKHYPD